LLCLSFSRAGGAQSENGNNKESNGLHYDTPEAFRDLYAGKMMKEALPIFRSTSGVCHCMACRSFFNDKRRM
jgi:hypothetical protein